MIPVWGGMPAGGMPGSESEWALHGGRVAWDGPEWNEDFLCPNCLLPVTW